MRLLDKGLVYAQHVRREWEVFTLRGTSPPGPEGTKLFFLLRFAMKHGVILEPFCNDILVVIAKHMKMNEAQKRLWADQVFHSHGRHQCLGSTLQ